ncbi:MAG: hypothetical protein Q7O66_13465, partial [Dehalococcoidia bacterium]|nr:hypothetical protein [Dehalococcoidia bacterium]
LYMGFVEKIAGGASHKPNLTRHGQPMDRKDMLRLKDAGLNCVSFQPEVWEPHLFAEVCPGKSKRDGYEGYLEAFGEAAEVFGAGNVAATFVGGVSLMPTNGHATWQESRDSMIEAFRWHISRGVFPYFLSLRLGVGSIYGDDKANQSFSRRMPPTDYYLDLALAHHELMQDHGLYTRLNKLMYCPLDCLSPLYGGEVGILALAGDVGNWLADTIPADANWLAKFIASMQPSTSTTMGG